MSATPAEMFRSSFYCTECGRSFASEDLARFGAQAVCADCKPRFVQRMREGAATAADVQYGGFWRRALALVIDSIVLMVINFPIQFILGMGFGTAISRRNSPAAGLAFVGLYWLLATAIAVSYYGYFLSQKSATPGKMVVGLKVTTNIGGRISVARAIGRYFAQMLSGLILCIGYIMAAFDVQKRALHDHICSTLVVRQG